MSPNVVTYGILITTFSRLDDPGYCCYTNKNGRYFITADMAITLLTGSYAYYFFILSQRCYFRVFGLYWFCFVF